MNSAQSAEMGNKEYRHGIVNAQIEVDLPLQIRALRKQFQLTQPELANLTGMKQPRISAMEKPGGAHFTLETLRRLAEAFDVALVVRFAPFGELLDWSSRFEPDNFRVPSFEQEVSEKESAPATHIDEPLQQVLHVEQSAQFADAIRNIQQIEMNATQINPSVLRRAVAAADAIEAQIATANLSLGENWAALRSAWKSASLLADEAAGSFGQVSFAKELNLHEPTGAIAQKTGTTRSVGAATRSDIRTRPRAFSVPAGGNIQPNPVTGVPTSPLLGGAPVVSINTGRRSHRRKSQQPERARRRLLLSTRAVGSRF